MSIEVLQSIHSSEDNLRCFECNSLNSSWACTENSIFVCIDCAHTLKSECGETVCLKSLSLASWSSEEIVKIQHGGNLRLKSLMVQYGIPKDVPLRLKYTSKAFQYYRLLLRSEIFNIQPPNQPRLDEGFDLQMIANKNWWGKTKDTVKSWVSVRSSNVFEGVSKNVNRETIEKIKNTGVNVICGLREYTCSTAYSAYNNFTEKLEPDYVKMEEVPNKDNNR